MHIDKCNMQTNKYVKHICIFSYILLSICKPEIHTEKYIIFSSVLRNITLLMGLKQGYMATRNACHSPETINNVMTFIQNYAEENAILLPDRISSHKWDDKAFAI